MKLILSVIMLALPAAAFAGERVIGVGIALTQQNHKYLVASVLPGTPAALDGTVHAGDEIVAVHPFEGSEPGWVPLDQFALDEAVQLIRGDQGSRVGLHLANSHGQYEVSLTREPFDVP